MKAVSARRFLPIVAVFAALGGSILPATAPPARAAATDLTVTTETRYDVQPDQSRVHVTTAVTAVNHLSNTKTRLYYFDKAYLAVQSGAAGFKITGPGGPSVHTASRTADHVLLRIDFGKRLPAGATRTWTLTFDLIDKGGAPTRQLRVGASLVTFPAWAFASKGASGGSVTVSFPAGYNIDVQAAGLRPPTTDATGEIVYQTGQLSQPLTFFAYFVADRPTDYAETTRSIDVAGQPLTMTLRAWPDDAAWAKRIGDLLGKGLPALGEAIGLPWLNAGPLVVAEAISRSTTGYSGLYDPTTGRIEIAYYAGSFVALHEAAHAWFDGNLLAERWANEGFASLYAVRAGKAIGVKVAADPLTDKLTAVRIPLNAWGPVGSADQLVEDYGYAASSELAGLVAARAGDAALTQVWQAAEHGIPAYQPPGLDENSVAGTTGAPLGAETGAAPPDWRGLLDLLDDKTGKPFDDLWRTWVVRPDEAHLLDERAAARVRYDEVVKRAGTLALPAVVRQAMRAWQFDEATQLLDAADRALDDRDSVTAAATAAGLTVPRTLRAAFEGEAGFSGMTAEADAEIATIGAYQTATSARPPQLDPIEQVGLWDATPNEDLERAKTAFVDGHLRDSVEASSSARAAWVDARDLGRNRVMSILAAIVAAILGLALLLTSTRRWSRRRRRRRRASQAHPLA
ncbi:MAG TPA: hypothetical protein VK697_05875 [Methylomirabilota bacterium]|nr:hypothetical protein [Methylomirabilota bacterium]